MRGIGYTLSRLPQVRALLAGAAIIAGSFISAAHGQSFGSGNGTGTNLTDGTRTDEAALAVPRIAHGGDAIALPQPLTPGNAAVLRQVFLLQQRNRVPEAIRASDGLGSTLLDGPVLADRFLGNSYRSTVSELTNWLSLYRDQPDAPQVHALLLAKLPKTAGAPSKPDVAILSQNARPGPVADATEGSSAMVVTTTARAAVELAAQGKVSQALRLAKSTRMSAAAAASLRAQVAQVLFTSNDDEGAMRLVQDSLKTTAHAEQNSLTGY